MNTTTNEINSSAASCATLEYGSNEDYLAAAKSAAINAFFDYDQQSGLAEAKELIDNEKTLKLITQVIPSTIITQHRLAFSWILDADGSLVASAAAAFAATSLEQQHARLTNVPAVLEDEARVSVELEQARALIGGRAELKTLTTLATGLILEMFKLPEAEKFEDRVLSTDENLGLTAIGTLHPEGTARNPGRMATVTILDKNKKSVLTLSHNDSK